MLLLLCPLSMNCISVTSKNYTLKIILLLSFHFSPNFFPFSSNTESLQTLTLPSVQLNSSFLPHLPVSIFPSSFLISLTSVTSPKTYEEKSPKKPHLAKLAVPFIDHFILMSSFNFQTSSKQIQQSYLFYWTISLKALEILSWKNLFASTSF